MITIELTKDELELGIALIRSSHLQGTPDTLPILLLRIAKLVEKLQVAGNLASTPVESEEQGTANDNSHSENPNRKARRRAVR